MFFQGDQQIYQETNLYIAYHNFQFPIQSTMQSLNRVSYRTYYNGHEVLLYGGHCEHLVTEAKGSKECTNDRYREVFAWLEPLKKDLKAAQLSKEVYQVDQPPPGVTWVRGPGVQLIVWDLWPLGYTFRGTSSIESMKSEN